MIKDAIKELVARRSLSRDQASEVMEEIMLGEASPAQVAAFATALRMKGETVDEIVGLAEVMRRRANRVHCAAFTVDTCGTGGDGAGTFNISTAAALVVAGAGVPVAKHGNRGITSGCGSADVLEALGVNIQMTPAEVEKCLEEVGIAFMYAPAFHPAMSRAAGPRREIGIKTVFNLLGPLTNPAGVKAQVVGVSDRPTAPKVVRALQELGAERAMVVHSEDGLDELTITGPSVIYEGIGENKPSVVELRPEDAGLRRAALNDIRGGSAERNAQIVRSVLGGDPGPCRDVVVLNAAAALMVAGQAGSFREGARLAAESIDSGMAGGKLERLASFSQSCGARRDDSGRDSSR
ncbi:MAG: anthranilate phosphoribosyltransferase [Chloroflexi bacterium]|nr:anthranilate phosphoribosyltransferase [Chloroflexota bacterium]